jgi:hypothetical protein
MKKSSNHFKIIIDCCHFPNIGWHSSCGFRSITWFARCRKSQCTLPLWHMGYWLPYFLLFEYTELKAVGIWIGLLAGLTAAALFLYIRFARLTRKLVMQNENK